MSTPFTHRSALCQGSILHSQQVAQSSSCDFFLWFLATFLHTLLDTGAEL
jgi:hypothetical protein